MKKEKKSNFDFYSFFETENQNLNSDKLVLFFLNFIPLI